MHIGDDPRGLLAAAVRRHNAEGLIQSRGRVSRHDLEEAYRDALCIVHPSFYEGFGLPVLEAQSIGCPVVCSTAGALPEVAGKGALFFDPKSSADLAQALVEMRDNVVLRRQLIRRGLENIGRFSWERCAKETADHLLTTVGPLPLDSI